VPQHDPDHARRQHEQRLRHGGRRSGDEIIVFDSTGTALQDVAAAAVVYERALASGAGIQVPLDI
jgi:ornithine cyclodeaminase/alanine dehydrogenase-like protein (mu-crystallin family)